MDLLELLTVLLIMNVWLPAVPTGLVFCTILGGYVAVNLRMAHWDWRHFKIFYSVGAGVAAYAAWGYATAAFSWNVFYSLFAAWMLTFRFDSFRETSGKMSTRRKLMIASWEPPKEGNILGALQLDMTHTLRYLAAKRAATGAKITITHLVTKAVGRTLRAMPHVNGRLVMGRYYPAESADVGVLVAVEGDAKATAAGAAGDRRGRNGNSSSGGGADLANAKICAADEKSLAEIAAELQSSAARLRAGRDADFNKSKPLLALLPTFLLRPMVEIVGLLGSLGLSVPALGVRPFPFGTAIITSVGSFGLDLAFVPQTPFARVPLIFMVGAITPKAVAERDPATQELRVVAKETLTLTVTVDHRFLDGKDGAKMATMLTQFLEHPETLEAP